MMVSRRTPTCAANCSWVKSFNGSTILPFVDHFPKNTELYRIMTTKPQELKKEDE